MYMYIKLMILIWWTCIYIDKCDLICVEAGNMFAVIVAMNFLKFSIVSFFISKFNHSQKYLISLQSIFHDHLFRNYFFPKCNQRNFPYKISCCFNYNELYSTIQYLITCITIFSFCISEFSWNWIALDIYNVLHLKLILCLIDRSVHFNALLLTLVIICQ